jgi:hypothetical protein
MSGSKELARLLSRIKHRKFGVLVTISYVKERAYQEVRDDGHPIIIIIIFAGADLVAIRKTTTIGTAAGPRSWLNHVGAHVIK